MKISIVHNFYRDSGGEDIVVKRESALMSQHGHHVSKFTAHNNDIEGRLSKTWTAFTAAYNPISRRRFAEYLREVRPDVVHVHNFFPRLSPAIFFAAKQLGIPTVLTLHNYRLLCPTCFLYPDDQLRERSLTHSCFWTVPRKTYKGSFFGTLAVATMVEAHKRLGTWSNVVDQFIALNSFAREKFIAGGLPAERIVVKGNASPTYDRPSVKHVRTGALYVGRLSEEKGIATLLEAWKTIDYPLTIVGSGPLEHLIPRSNANIRFLGRLPSNKVRDEMHRATFLVLPSTWYEMFPMTAVEAYACALPVIGSDISGLSDVIRDHETGLSFSAGDAESLKQRVIWAAEHPEVLRAYGENARKVHEESYSDEPNYRQLMHIYEGVVSKSARRPPPSLV